MDFALGIYSSEEQPEVVPVVGFKQTEPAGQSVHVLALDRYCPPSQMLVSEIEKVLWGLIMVAGRFKVEELPGGVILVPNVFPVQGAFEPLLQYQPSGQSAHDVNETT